MINYLDQENSFYNELEAFYPYFFENIIRNYKIKTTWFLRIDSQMEKIFGSPDHTFKANAKILNLLKENKSEIGWHHHAYKQANGKWVQETNEDIVEAELKKYGEIAICYDLQICRMGWGFQTNKTLKALNNLGFVVDSSSIPRPKYKWDISLMDWEEGYTKPYYPSTMSYKTSAVEHLSILEVPITTSYLKASYDTEKVIRYVNPAYHHKKFIESFTNIHENEFICMIMHPYEVMQNAGCHDLISFSIEELKKNIDFLLTNKYEFISYSDLLKNSSF